MTRDSDPLSTEEGTFVPLPDIDTFNEFMLSRGGSGAGAYVAPQVYPRFKSRQQAYRFAAWCELMGETLPPEGVDRSFDEIRQAIRET